MPASRPTVILLLAASTLLADRLWYKQPATKWVEALPIGNGRLGGMVFGGVEEDHIQLNEDTVWAGEKRDRNNPDGGVAIPKVRSLLREGRLKEAEALADKSIISIPRRLPPYQTLGDLYLKFSNVVRWSNYSRELDLDTAVVRVKYQIAGSGCVREVFSSAIDQLIVMRVGCDQPGLVSFSATMNRPADSTTTTQLSNRVILAGQAMARDERHADERKTGVHFRAVTHVVASGGTTTANGTSVDVRNANSAVLFIAAATDFRGKDPAAECERNLNASTKAFDQMREAHVRDYQSLFRRVSFQLSSARPDIPTDERLTRVQQGAVDSALETLYFQFGRYLLISCSRPGTMAATLQGLWNDQLDPSWDSKYTININTEMNYWPAEITNLPELHEPLFDLIENAREDGRRIARDLWGAKGFVLHHNTDAWGHAVPIDGVGSGIWPMGAAWLSLHYWDHYDYTRDKSFLAKRAYPVMKEAAEFLLTSMVEENGRLLSGPSISPENRYKNMKGEIGKLAMSPTMDVEITYALFRRVIEAALILNTDKPFADQLRSAMSKLPPLKIGSHGQLLEWQEEYEEPEPGHRHISHLFALHPDDQITLRGTPDLARSAKKTLERRLEAGSGHTGWSRAWIINFWARLEEGNTAHENIVALLAKSTHPNLLDNHPPFQIDGNFGGVAGMVEMLMQSHGGEISLLPALPKAWPEGSITGLRARGAIGVDLKWANGKLVEAILRPAYSSDQKVRLPGRDTKTIKLEAGRPYRLGPS